MSNWWELAVRSSESKSSSVFPIPSPEILHKGRWSRAAKIHWLFADKRVGRMLEKEEIVTEKKRMRTKDRTDFSALVSHNTVITIDNSVTESLMIFVYTFVNCWTGPLSHFRQWNSFKKKERLKAVDWQKGRIRERKKKNCKLFGVKKKSRISFPFGQLSQDHDWWTSERWPRQLFSFLDISWKNIGICEMVNVGQR